jgi:hypothetical protein
MATYHCPRGTTMYIGSVYDENENFLFEGEIYITRSACGDRELIQFVKGRTQYLCLANHYTLRPFKVYVKVLDPRS